MWNFYTIFIRIGWSEKSEKKIVSLQDIEKYVVYSAKPFVLAKKM